MQVGYNKSTNQFVVIKKFLANSEDDYKIERDIYRHLKSHSCGDLSLDLLHSDDSRNLLVIERGICDLKTFAELRCDPTHPDGPLTPFELIIVMEYVATAMKRLSEIGVSLCDTKE